MSFLFSSSAEKPKELPLTNIEVVLSEVDVPPEQKAQEPDKVEQTSEDKSLVPRRKKIQSVVSRKVMPLAMIMAKGQKKGTKGARRTAEIVRLFSNDFPFFPTHVANENTYKLSQFVNVGTITSNIATAVFAAFAFVASAIDQISSLTAVFDQYRIDELEVWFWPKIQPGTGTISDPGLFATAVDYDDATALSTYNQALDYQNVLVSDGRQGHYHRFKPHAAIAAYSGAFTSFANQASPWIDAASTGVQHYGVKGVWTATDTTGYTYAVQARFHMSFRNVR